MYGKYGILEEQRRLFSSQLEHDHFRRHLRAHRRTPEAVAVAGDSREAAALRAAIVKLIHHFRYDAVREKLASMRVACQVQVIAGGGSSVHAARLVVKQDAVIAFVCTCKVQQLLSRALPAVIVDAGDFDVAVDNSICVAQHVEAFFREHLLPAQRLVEIIVVAEGHVNGRFNLREGRQRILLFDVEDALVEHIAADNDKVRLFGVDACCQTLGIIMAKNAPQMQVGKKDDFISGALRQLGRQQRLCAHRRMEGTPAAPGDEAADEGEADDAEPG